MLILQIKNRMEITSAEEALSHTQSSQTVFVHSAAMTPQKLTEVLDRIKARHLKVVHIHTEGSAEYTKHLNGDFHTYSCFVGANIRKEVNMNGNVNYIPIFLSEIHQILKAGQLKVDVALLQVSPPDKHGFCSLGCSVDVSLAAMKSASLVIAEINPNVPRSHGDGVVHIDNIHFGVEADYPMFSVAPKTLTDEEKTIGKNIAELIEDGSTLQMGIGGIPNAVLAELGGHKNLGIHTEMFSDGVLPLVEKGVINGSEKKILPGKIATCFAIGSQNLYDFIDDNPSVTFKEASYTNDTAIIRRNPKVVAINSALEVDITGQVCADSIGTFQYSGVGGQMDFIRGASLSLGGKPIIAMPSQTRKGDSKISAVLKPGASVTTTRAHVHWVVTEFGAVDLFGKDLVERARLLTSIAHPNHRESLEKVTKERYHL